MNVIKALNVLFSYLVDYTSGWGVVDRTMRLLGQNAKVRRSQYDNINVFHSKPVNKIGRSKIILNKRIKI